MMQKTKYENTHITSLELSIIGTLRNKWLSSLSLINKLNPTDSRDYSAIYLSLFILEKKGYITSRWIDESSKKLTNRLRNGRLYFTSTSEGLQVFDHDFYSGQKLVYEDILEIESDPLLEHKQHSKKTEPQELTHTF